MEEVWAEWCVRGKGGRDERAASEEIVLLDALCVEDDHASVAHVEGDDGSWVGDYLTPEVGIGVVGMFDNEDGVGGG